MLMTRSEIEATGTSYDDLVAWVANDYLDGAVQALFTEQQLDDGAHYAEARTILTDPSASDIVAEFNRSI